MAFFLVVKKSDQKLLEMWRDEKQRRQMAEGELSIVKGIGNNSPEMKVLKAENEKLKSLYAKTIEENKTSKRLIVELLKENEKIKLEKKIFKNKFILPLDNAIITGVYGSQRILNGKPRWPHYGVDFAGDLGTPIKAMADGIVTLAENDLYFTGATLIFDHGHGISTLYMHMDEIFVEKGDIVKQGDVIGTVGSSGRSTGPHLDVRLNWFGTRLDPATVLDINLSLIHI